MSKAGIKRIAGVDAVHTVRHAQLALSLLELALKQCRLAGSCYTAERVRHAISSAKGAVRAAEYRKARLSR